MSDLLIWIALSAQLVVFGIAFGYKNKNRTHPKGFPSWVLTVQERNRRNKNE